MTDIWAKTRVERQIKVMKIVWLVLLATPAIYLFILTSKVTAEPLDWQAVYADFQFQLFAGVSGVLLILSRVLPSKIFSYTLKNELARPWTDTYLRNAATSKGQRIYRDEDIPKLLALQGEDLRSVRAGGAYMISKLIPWSLCESVAIFGFLLAMQFKSMAIYYPFAGVALLAIATMGPSFDDMKTNMRGGLG